MFKALKISMIAALCIISSAAYAYNVGDITGNILSTDIKTNINGKEITSFNIAGRTAIITQDLAQFGFGVEFDEASRILTLSECGANASPIEYTPVIPADSHPVGTVVGNVYYTDIVTKYNESEIESFNIGGLTCVYADDLAQFCGTYLWDDQARSVTLDIPFAGKYAVTSSSHIQKFNSGRTLPADKSETNLAQTMRRWGSAANSHLIKNSDGTFLAVEINENINIEKYNSEFKPIQSYAIPRELPIFSTLYCGKDYNYIAFGQENLNEDNSREVIRIVIYNKEFVKISEVSVNNCKTSVPFDASCGEMTEDDRYLVLHTSRSQYKDEKGDRPQTQLTVIIDKTTWSVCNLLGMFQPNHISHALREFVKMDSDRIVTLNLSDAAPMRGLFIQSLDYSGSPLDTYAIFNACGPSGVNCTGIMPGGFEVTDKGYLAAINTIDQSIPTGCNNLGIEGVEREIRDIYAISVSRLDGAVKHICLAGYTYGSMTGGVPYLVPLDNNRYIVIWQSFDSVSGSSGGVSYVIIDSDANILSDVCRDDTAVLSDSCQPIVAGGKVIWYVNTLGGRDFYSLNVSDIEFVQSENPVQALQNLPLISEPDNKTDEETETEANKQSLRKDKYYMEVDGI